MLIAFTGVPDNLRNVYTVSITTFTDLGKATGEMHWRVF